MYSESDHWSTLPSSLAGLLSSLLASLPAYLPNITDCIQTVILLKLRLELVMLQLKNWSVTLDDHQKNVQVTYWGQESQLLPSPHLIFSYLPLVFCAIVVLTTSSLFTDCVFYFACPVPQPQSHHACLFVIRGISAEVTSSDRSSLTSFCKAIALY